MAPIYRHDLAGTYLEMTFALVGFKISYSTLIAFVHLLLGVAFLVDLSVTFGYKSLITVLALKLLITSMDS
jgi:uncharacterized membrane protein (DUF485 family)